MKKILHAYVVIIVIIATVAQGAVTDPEGSGELPETDEYTCDIQSADIGKRIHEGRHNLGPDCLYSDCSDTCRGGQCAALVKCNCKRDDKYFIPNTSCWGPGTKVEGTDGKCNRAIAPNTAIATFGKNGRYSAHAAVFIRCIDDHKVEVYDQWCARSVNHSQYPSKHPFFSAFAVIKNSGCNEELEWDCRETSPGPNECGKNVPKRCK